MILLWIPLCVNGFEVYLYSSHLWYRMSTLGLVSLSEVKIVGNHQPVMDPIVDLIIHQRETDQVITEAVMRCQFEQAGTH